MSRRFVIHDPFKFAAENRSLSGKAPVGEFKRLTDVLADSSGEISWSLEGRREVTGSAFLMFGLRGELKLVCQRCLEVMDWALDSRPMLKLVRPGVPIPDEELEVDAFDSVEALADMDVLAMVEDEILLAVPSAPRHERCDAPRPLGEDGDKSPFAVLATLRKAGGAS